jgi:hypothetical protein
MSMFSNAFGGGNSQTQAAPAPAPVTPQPGNLPVNPTTPSTPANVNEPVGTPAPQQEGLDQFTDLWKPAETPAGGANNSLFNVDPAKLMEAAGKMDFSKAVSPEQLQAISQGGEGAMQAFATAMNKVAQTVYAQNAMATTKIVEQALARSKESFMGELPRHIKNQQVSDTLRTENPALSHPAAAPILGALQQQMAVKFPNATASELAALSKQYLENFANLSRKPDSNQTQSQSKSNEQDWSAFLS